MDARERMILALDVERFEEAREMIDRYKDYVGMFKVGKQLFTQCGPKIVDFIKMKGGKVFLDLKYHDIPNTVSKAAVEATKLGADMFNVHASGGPTMMRQTREAVNEACSRMALPKPIIIGVTVLTSLDDEELKRVGFDLTAKELTKRLALLTKEAGLDGVVASGLELEMIRETCGKDFVIVTPGVRITDQKDDQKRTTGPKAAIERGATYLVLGRTVLTAANPEETLKLVEEQINNALSIK